MLRVVKTLEQFAWEVVDAPSLEMHSQVGQGSEQRV